MKFLPKILKNSKGFTIPELLIVMGILVILFGLITPNLIGFRQQSVINTSADVLINDLKSQQLKAMVGDTEGRVTSDHYGIYFESNQYTLFHGTTFDSMDPDNYVVSLDPSLTFTNINVPNSSIIFTRGNGEVMGFTAGSDTVEIVDSTNGNSVTIQTNIYGALDRI